MSTRIIKLRVLIDDAGQIHEFGSYSATTNPDSVVRWRALSAERRLESRGPESVRFEVHGHRVDGGYPLSSWGASLRLGNTEIPLTQQSNVYTSDEVALPSGSIDLHLRVWTASAQDDADIILIKDDDTEPEPVPLELRPLMSA